MKHTCLFVLAVAVTLHSCPAFAQHGHGPGGPGGMGSANANNGSSHASGVNGAGASGKSMNQLLTQNTKLSEKISSLTGESAQQACNGFKNLGQCVAAAHVSKNLDISFTCLKSEMTGTAPSGSTSGCPAATTGKSMSLGQAISTLSPKVNNKTEAKKGAQQAKQDLRDTTNNS